MIKLKAFILNIFFAFLCSTVWSKSDFKHIFPFSIRDLCDSISILIPIQYNSTVIHHSTVSVWFLVFGFCLVEDNVYTFMFRLEISNESCCFRKEMSFFFKPWLHWLIRTKKDAAKKLSLAITLVLKVITIFSLKIYYLVEISTTLCFFFAVQPIL